MKLNVNRKFKDYFFKILANISVFFISVIILLSVILYFSFVNFGLDIINKSDQMILTQISHNVEYIDSYVKSFGASLFINPNVTELMYAQDIPILDTLKDMKLIGTSIKSTPYVQSVYIYNGKQKRYYIVGPYPDMKNNDFYDKEIVSLLNCPGNIKNQPIARKAPLNDIDTKETVNVYTYIFDETDKNSNTVKNALVVNINVDWLFKTFIADSQNQFVEKSEEIFILDNNGINIGDINNNRYLKDMKEMGYINRILDSEKQSGYFVEKVNKEQSVVVFSSLEFPAWKFVSITPYRIVAGSINRVRTIMIVICLLVLIMGLLLSYMLSKKLYLPIGRLKKNMGQLQEGLDSDDEPINEFDFITSKFSAAVDKLSSLESFKNKNINLLKQEYLKDLLFNKIKPLKDSDLHIKELGIELELKNSFVVIIFKLDEYYEFNKLLSEADQSLYKFALANISAEVFRNQFLCESIDSNSDHTINILNVNELSEDIMTNIYQAVRDIHRYYYEYCKIGFSAFISNKGNITSLNELYEEALKISVYRISYGQACILSTSMLKSIEAVRYDISDKSVAPLLEALKYARLQEANECMRNIVTGLYNCDYSNIMFTFSHIASTIFNMLGIIEQNSTAVFDIDYINFNKKILQLETLEQIKCEFLELFKAITEKINQNKDNKHDIIIANAVKYIKNKYSDKNLSLEMVSDFLKISMAYLGKLFREEMAKTVGDYIKEYRLNIAKELLKNTNYTIDEIVDKIGWGNKKYFSTVFKQTFGVTPMEYRLNSAINEEMDGLE